ncbi:hypothetical protein QWY90_04250 [Flavobacterium paronense]|uniref:Uncharacterized protein n=1 Tax=Flavobacterium paronense TaxID=1392775 RepID=A0ABV5GHA5_9FLAO|nr:hypothetical protein [Flavobacterium paronense]MDN3676517.1 hypothetical protein [Flavobacterium paronense]
MKTATSKSILFLLLQCLLLCVTDGNSQNYRNAKAYINDFGKNEYFVNEALAEYSAAIINNQSNNRLGATLERIYSKLEDVNAILIKNDVGIMGDTKLRDNFVLFNFKTINLLKNKYLILNDYTIQSALDYPTILNNFSQKEIELSKYYKSLITYKNIKKEFAIKYSVNLKNTSNTKNVFEYNSYQNLIFYKINVLDEKLMALLKDKNIDKVGECFKYMTSIGEESNKKLDSYADDYKDTSLNTANRDFIAFMLKQKELLYTPYVNYVKEAAAMQLMKTKFEKDSKSIPLETYNAEVRNYNKLKNIFFDMLTNIQISKKQILDSWYLTNSKFLKNNIEYKDDQEQYTAID